MANGTKETGVLMGVPTFQALDISAFHSAQEGYDCTRSTRGRGTIAN